jgi:serine protease Do
MKIMKRIKIKYLLACLIILCLVLGSSCQLLPTNSSPSTSTTNPIDQNWTLPTAESQALILPSIADVVALVKPSVVAINTEATTYFLGQIYKEEGAGSGWIIDDENGYIVTNNHVIEGASTITVTLDDGRTFPASVVGADALTDLAVLKIDAQNLTKVGWVDSSELRIGDWVVAIGNSLGLGISATKGIVSALGVSIPTSAGQTLYDLIQTDAAINPGNSGGPLVNMAGKVVGITSVKISMVGVEGMGWAISTKVAMPIIEELINRGYVVRPWLGVEGGLYTVDTWAILRYRLAVDEGAFITEVASGSPADEVGIEPGDVITEFEDEEITTAEELNQAIHSSQIGQTVKITYWRGNSEKTTYATLTESPPP